MTHSRGLGLCFRVNLSPDLLRVHRIADFGENVHILYVAEMALDTMFLLGLLTFERPKFARIPYLIDY